MAVGGGMVLVPPSLAHFLEHAVMVSRTQRFSHGSLTSYAAGH